MNETKSEVKTVRHSEKNFASYRNFMISLKLRNFAMPDISNFLNFFDFFEFSLKLGHCS